MKYHLHVYFNDSSETTALEVRQRVAQRTEVLELGRFHSAPVGPHPVRQFQILVDESDLIPFRTWLDENRAGLDVLIHPDIDDDLLAHTERATWLGQPHRLVLTIFSKTPEPMTRPESS